MIKKRQSKKIGFYIDTNIFVAYARKREENHLPCKNFIDYIKKCMKNGEFNKKFDFFSSKFTEAEIASALKRRKLSEDKIRGFLHKMGSPAWDRTITTLPGPTMTIKEFVPEIVEVAIKYGAKFADNVQACCIELYKDSIDYIITNDEEFKRKLKRKLKRIKILTIGDAMPLLKSLKKQKQKKEK